MLDRWFVEDISSNLVRNNRFVIVDRTGSAEFLLQFISNDITLIKANTTKEELSVKYWIEKKYYNKKVLIYTTTPLNSLLYIREYCETGGKLEIKSLAEYIKKKLIKTKEIELQMPDSDIETLGRYSIGKDNTYWEVAGVKGLGAIFENFEEDLLMLVNSSDEFIKKHIAGGREVFFKLLAEKLNLSYFEKPCETWSKEIKKAIFDNFFVPNSNEFLIRVYIKWINSRDLEKNFKTSTENYKYPLNIDYWTVDTRHPFKDIDRIWLQELIYHLNDRNYLNDKIEIIKARQKNTSAYRIGVDFWESVLTLLNFKSSEISQIDTYEKAVEYYTGTFYKIDTSFRELTGYFLQEQELLKPIQEYYDGLMNIYLEKWFLYYDRSKENQSGVLHQIFSDENKKTAVIICDGLRYELAKSYIPELESLFRIDYSSKLADIPSETKNGMSRLFLDSNAVEPVQKNREDYFRQNFPDTEILYVEEIVNREYPKKFLVAKSNDIDSISEKIQQEGLKYLSQTMNNIIDKVKILLNNSFKKVYITSDHGFVLTGLINSSYKVNFESSSDSIYKSERYILSKEPIKYDTNSILRFEKDYEGYKYLYFSKSTNPFITRGAYGYAHGGISPQEIIIPYFRIEKRIENEQISASIANKKNLEKSITDMIEVKVKGDDEGLFSKNPTRKCKLIFKSSHNILRESSILSISAGSEHTIEEEILDAMEFEILLIDVLTQETLDSVKVKKQIVRNIGL